MGDWKRLRKVPGNQRAMLELNTLRDELEVLRLAVEIVGEYSRRRGVPWQEKRIAILEEQAQALGDRLEWLRSLLLEPRGSV